MARSLPASEFKPTEPRSLGATTQERLPKWVLLSLVVHVGLILFLVLVPFGSSRKREPPPSYVVDLVGGEKIGGRNLGTQLDTETKAKPRAPEAPPEPVAKKETKAEKASKTEKAEKAKPREEIVLAKSKRTPKPEDRKKETVQEPSKEAKDAAKTDENALEKVRERVIQAAIERARSRAASAESTSRASKSEPLSAGSGEGLGAQSLGKGGIGGEGILKGVEFIAYQNRLVNTIKANWAWAGRKSDLKVVVQFGIKENGEVAGLRVTQRSGDPTYDESVIRAIKRSSPFTPPPESHQKEFADVEMTFKPSDFGA
jgi:TolA protein